MITAFMGTELEDFVKGGTAVNDNTTVTVRAANVRGSVLLTAAAEDTNYIESTPAFSLAELWTKFVGGWSPLPNSGTQQNFIKWYAGGTQRLAVRYTDVTTGALELRKWNGSSWDSLATTTNASAILSGTNTKVVFDFYVKLGNPGEFRMYVGEVLVWSLTGLDLTWSGVTALDKVRWNTWTTTRTIYVSECLVTDWSTLFGKLVLRTTSANGSYSEWAGAGYTAVDDFTPTSDYMASDTADQRVTFTMASFPALGSGESIATIKASAYALRDAAGPQNINLMTRISSTDYHDSNQALSVASTTVSKQWDLSPATAAVWTVTEINGAQFGARSRT